MSKEITDENHQEETILAIVYSDANDGYMIDVYNSRHDFENGNSRDGALCTGTYEDAMEWGAELITGTKI